MAAISTTTAPAAGSIRRAAPRGARLTGMWRYVRRNPSMAVGLVLTIGIALFCIVGALEVNTKVLAYPLAVAANQAPSAKYPFGTDSQGRDLLATTIVGTALTLRIGLTAGAIGLGVGTVLAFVAAYYGGFADTVIRWLVDVLLTIPGLLILIVIAATNSKAMSVETMSLVVALLAWLHPARNMRAQVLSLRERPFLAMARLSGMNGPEIIVREMMPNLLPYIAASFVGAVTAAIFASIGLEALGLGPLREPTLGMTIYWVLYYSALLKGMWWWALAPVTVIVLIFVTLFLLSAGLDEVANPRVRRAA